MTAPATSAPVSSTTTPASATHNVVMPATVNAGDLLLVAISMNASGSTITTPGGWTFLDSQEANGSGDVLFLFAKIADGTEDGATVNFSGSNVISTAHAYRVTGWWGTVATGIATVKTSGTGTSPNPSNLAPGWGTPDTLWFVFSNAGNGSSSLTSGNQSSGYTFGASTVTTALGTANHSFYKAATASSDDPAAFTINTSSVYAVFTVAIRPASTTFTITPTGSITATGALGLAAVIARTLTGSITPAGALVKTTLKALVGSIAGAGIVVRNGQRDMYIPVVAAADDGTWQPTILGFDDSITQAGRAITTVLNSFYRYLFYLDKSVIIIGAWFWFPGLTKSGSPVLRIYGESTPNQAAVTSSADGEGRTLTTAFVDWTPSASGAQFSPNFGTVLQEVVNATIIGTSWQVFLKDNGSAVGTNRVTTNNYETDPGPINSTHLLITYQSIRTITVAGSITAAGALIKTTLKALVGSTTPAGASIKTTAKAMTGSVTAAGALVKTTLKAFVGSITPAGALTNSVLKLILLVGSITPAGSLVKTTAKALAGSATATGSLVRTVLKAVTGSCTAAGSLIKLTAKTLVGSSTPVGSLVKLVSKLLTGVITATGRMFTGDEHVEVLPNMDRDSSARINPSPDMGRAMSEETNEGKASMTTIPPTGRGRLRWPF